MGSRPNGRVPPSREQLFALAWRIVNPEAPIDSPITQIRMLRDAAAIGAFENRPPAAPATEDTVNEFRAVIAQWENRHPDHPAFRRCLYQLLSLLTAEAQANRTSRS